MLISHLYFNPLCYPDRDWAAINDNVQFRTSAILQLNYWSVVLKAMSAVRATTWWTIIQCCSQLWQKTMEQILLFIDGMSLFDWFLLVAPRSTVASVRCSWLPRITSSLHKLNKCMKGLYTSTRRWLHFYKCKMGSLLKTQCYKKLPKVNSQQV